MNEALTVNSSIEARDQYLKEFNQRGDGPVIYIPRKHEYFLFLYLLTRYAWEKNDKGDKFCRAIVDAHQLFVSPDLCDELDIDPFYVSDGLQQITEQEAEELFLNSLQEVDDDDLG